MCKLETKWKVAIWEKYEEGKEGEEKQIKKMAH
jgi:hypothetical protein